MPASPPEPPDPNGPAAPEVRDPSYARTYAMTLAKWMLYHQDNIVFDKVHWMGVRALKNPLDCWIYLAGDHRFAMDRSGSVTCSPTTPAAS